MVESTVSKFYEALLKVWSNHSFPPMGEMEIRNEVLWHNRFMGVPLQDPILRKRWGDAGINTMHDICHPVENRLLSHSEIKDKFQVHCTFWRPSSFGWPSLSTGERPFHRAIVVAARETRL